MEIIQKLLYNNHQFHNQILHNQDNKQIEQLILHKIK